MNCRTSCNSLIFDQFPIVRLDKNLRTRKGSRRGNAGNRLELQVLTQIHHVP
ncbi:uncharacterized protein [Onthophagus taurus]|uniref:uncharacterized protein n=1 Tax=Onthophagus taurus TaxID=166361 RepID=UPI000C209FB1|nr:uncharacterized protein LOC111429109 [Onthophagus taurus]